MIKIKFLLFITFNINGSDNYKLMKEKKTGEKKERELRKQLINYGGYTFESAQNESVQKKFTYKNNENKNKNNELKIPLNSEEQTGVFNKISTILKKVKGLFTHDS